MDCLDLAAQLGQAIAESKEMKTVKEKEAALLADKDGLKLLEEKRQLQEKLVKATRANAPEAEIDAARKELMTKQAEIDEHTTTKEYADAKKYYEKLMADVNSVVNFYISGGDQGGCTGSCSTCGGCG
jgi:cell fate (sporulation/competence/biofilm development) regulator YlbF (YheA/YmcA/DUF963 family)